MDLWLFPGVDLTNNQGNQLLRAPGIQGAPSDTGKTYLVNAPVCICVLESLKCSLIAQNAEFLSSAEFCKLANPLIITMCRYDVNKRFIVQCRELH